jgi:exonuclease SbcC
MAHTETIDRAISNTTGDISSNKSEARRLNEEVVNIQEDLKQYDYLKDMKQNIDEAEILLEQISVKTSNFNHCIDIYDKLQAEKQRKLKLEEIINTNKVYSEILVLCDQLLTKYKEYDSIKNIINKRSTMASYKESSLETIQNYANVDEVISIVDEISEKIRNYQSISNKILKRNQLMKEVEILNDKIKKNTHCEEAISVLNECQQKLSNYKVVNDIALRIESHKKRLTQLNQKVPELKAKLDSAIEKYKVAVKESGKCPVCFSEVDERTLQNISDNLF